MTVGNELDHHDELILSELQSDGRITMAELGRRVGLSQPAVTERVRKLETSGVITGYHAAVDPGRLWHLGVNRGRQKDRDIVVGLAALGLALIGGGGRLGDTLAAALVLEAEHGAGGLPGIEPRGP